MKDKTNNNNLPEKPDKVSLKTPSDFPSSLNLQLKEFHASPTFFRNLKQNKQTLWVILQNLIVLIKHLSI